MTTYNLQTHCGNEETDREEDQIGFDSHLQKKEKENENLFNKLPTRHILKLDTEAVVEQPLCEKLNKSCQPTYIVGYLLHNFGPYIFPLESSPHHKPWTSTKD